MTRRVAPLAVVGDALLDRDIVGDVSRVCPDAPVPVVQVRDERARPGGAALTAWLASRLYDGPVLLVARLGTGPLAEELRGLMEAAGVTVIDLGGSRPITEKVRVRAGGQSLVRLDRDHDDETGSLDDVDGERLVAALAGAAAVVVSDYGRGLTHGPRVRDALTVTAERAAVVWDPHRNGGPPVAGCRLVTPNEREAAHLVGEPVDEVEEGREQEPSVVAATRRAALLAQRWGVHAVAVTLGRRGAVVADRHGLQVAAPGVDSIGGDTCGAGDCFAAAAGVALGQGRLPSEAVAWAVDQAGRYVAAGGPASVDAARCGGAVRGRNAERPWGPAGGGRSGPEVTVVATSGCFDLLHAGHVQMLTAARRLGDRLVVLLNSDAGVRRLKGSDRPLQSQADRAAVLSSLACVDEVVVFDEDIPVAALERLRPQLFVKGGDYHAADLPEAEALLRWGGRAVTVPYLPDRSTTRLVAEAGRLTEEAARHAR